MLLWCRCSHRLHSLLLRLSPSFSLLIVPALLLSTAVIRQGVSLGIPIQSCTCTAAANASCRASCRLLVSLRMTLHWLLWLNPALHCTAWYRFELPGSVDMVIEAVIEDIGLKQRIFADLEASCPPHAILATNTSTIDIELVGAKLKVGTACRLPQCLPLLSYRLAIARSCCINVFVTSCCQTRQPVAVTAVNGVCT